MNNDSTMIPDLMESWAPVSGYEGRYEVSDLGRVRTLSYHQTGRSALLRPQKATAGYFQVRTGKVLQNVHLLVMQSFSGPKPEGKEINHKNGDKADNRRGNLEYCTRKENIVHSFRIGLQNNRGENNPISKLEEDDVRTIRIMYKSGALRQSQIAKLFRVSRQVVNKIVHGRAWTHVKEEAL